MHIGKVPWASQSVSELPRLVTRLMGCFSRCIGKTDHDHIYIYISLVLPKLNTLQCIYYIIRNSIYISCSSMCDHFCWKERATRQKTWQQSAELDMSLCVWMHANRSPPDLLCFRARRFLHRPLARPDLIHCGQKNHLQNKRASNRRYCIQNSTSG